MFERDDNLSDDEAVKLELEAIGLQEFVELDLPPRKNILSPILPERGLAMLFAERGVGKTHVALGIAYAVSCGGEFLRWRAEKSQPVLYVDGEMPQQLLQERFQALMARSSNEGDWNESFWLLSMDRQRLGTSLNLANPEHQKAIDEQLYNAKLLVLDNLSTLVNGGPENDAESWDSMQAWLLQLRRRGVTVLVVHHAGRGGNARGTSKREDVLDTVIQLKHPEDYDPEDGARFEVHLTKARGVYGEEAMAFEARLDKSADSATWICADIGEDDEEDLESVMELAKEDKSIREIAAATGISKSRVQRLLKKGKAQQRAQKYSDH